MSEVWVFVKAIWHRGAEAMAGVVFTVGGLVWAAIAVVDPTVASWTVKPWMVWGTGLWFVILAAFVTWRDERRARLKSDGDLAAMQAQNRGIDLDCSGLKFSWSDEPELPEGVLVVLDVERLVNGNLYDVVVDVRLVAPVWRSGTFTVTTSSQAISRSVAKVKATAEQLKPLINLRQKTAVGPGYYLFFFGYTNWKDFVFVPESVKATTLDQFAALIYESELEIHIYDRASGMKARQVMAPGTLEKRQKRLGMEDAVNAEGPST